MNTNQLLGIVKSYYSTEGVQIRNNNEVHVFRENNWKFAGWLDSVEEYMWEYVHDCNNLSCKS